jgi:hypothetical protein
MTATTHSQTNALLDYPAPRATGCPFDPAPALLDKLVHDRLIRVRLPRHDTLAGHPVR